MNLQKTLAKTLAMMRLSGLVPPYGTDPKTDADAILQVEIYLANIRDALPGVADADIENAITEAGCVCTKKLAKFPSAAEFAAECAAVESFRWMLLAVPDATCGTVAHRVLKTISRDEVNALVQQAAAALPARRERTVEEAKALAEKLLGRKMTKAEEMETEEAIAYRDAQIARLRATEIS